MTLNEIYNQLHQLEMELIPHVTPKADEAMLSQQLLTAHHLELTKYYLMLTIKSTQNEQTEGTDVSNTVESSDQQ